MKVKNQNLLNEAKIKWKRKNIDVSKIVDCVDSAAKIIWLMLKESEYKNYLEYKECSFIFYADRKNEITGFSLLSIGSIACCIIDTKEVLRNCLLTMSENFFIVHNHPSGNTTPSQADNAITKKIHEASKTIDLKMLDHFILDFETGKYYSYTDNGKL